MFSLFGKPKEEVVAVFDIGNGSVGGALIKVSSQHPPIILYTHRVPILYTSHVTSGRLMAQMQKLLKSIAENLTKEGVSHIHQNYFGPTISGVHCVFASPWFISQSKTLRNNFENQTTISQSYLDELVRKEEENFKTSLRENPHTKAFAENITLIEQKITDIKLNGYSVQAPIGKNAREIELTFFSSFVPNDVLGAVESILHRSFNFRKIRYHSYALASCISILKMFPEPNDFLFLDITGEVCDISVVKDSILVETASFPYGRGTALRNIAKDLKADPQVAYTYLQMHYKKSLEKKFESKLAESMNRISSDWTGSLVESLKQISKRHSIPKVVYITVDEDVANFFFDAVSNNLPIELNVQNNKFEAIVLNQNSLGGQYHVAPNVTDDSFLGIESVYVSDLLNKKSV